MFSIPLGLPFVGQVIAVFIGIIVVAALLEAIGHVIIKVIGKIMEERE